MESTLKKVGVKKRPRRRSPSSEEEEKRPRVKRLRPDCRRFGGLLKQVVASRREADAKQRSGADAKLAAIEFGGSASPDKA